MGSTYVELVSELNCPDTKEVVAVEVEVEEATVEGEVAVLKKEVALVVMMTGPGHPIGRFCFVFQCAL